jgi:hypothetical protein
MAAKGHGETRQLPRTVDAKRSHRRTAGATGDQPRTHGRQTVPVNKACKIALQFAGLPVRPLLENRGQPPLGEKEEIESFFVVMRKLNFVVGEG